MSGVTVVCPNNRRVTVKFDGAVKTLYQILDEACKKQGFVPEKYGLKNHGRFVDLSVTFRMSGLPQNCTLEMAELDPNEQQRQVKRESEDVQVALQLPDGRRLMNNVPSEATLLDALLQFEKQSELKLVEPENEGENMHPVCYYLNNEVIGCKALGATTLKELGVRGRALFRYATRKVDPSKMQEINDAIERSRAKQRKMEETYEKKLKDNLDYERDQQRRREEEEALEQLRQQRIEVQSIASTTDIVMSESLTPVAARSPDTEPKHADDDDHGASSTVSGIADRQARLDALQSMLAMVDRSIVEGSDLPWDVDQTRQPAPSVGFANFKFPEETKGVDLRSRDNNAQANRTSIIEPCERHPVAFSLADVAEVVSEELPPEVFDLTVDDVQSMLRDIKDQSEERALLPESYVRQKDFERKVLAWKTSVIRIRMPDRTVLQGAFRSLENVEALYRFVEESLRSPVPDFQLCLPPNVAIDKRDYSLLQAGLAPRATLLFKQKSGDAREVYLSETLMEQIKTLAEADHQAAESLAGNSSYVPFRPPVVGGEGQRAASGGASAAGGGRSDTMPKWMPGKGKK